MSAEMNAKKCNSSVSARHLVHATKVQLHVLHSFAHCLLLAGITVWHEMWRAKHMKPQENAILSWKNWLHLIRYINAATLGPSKSLIQDLWNCHTCVFMGVLLKLLEGKSQGHCPRRAMGTSQVAQAQSWPAPPDRNRNSQIQIVISYLHASSPICY